MSINQLVTLTQKRSASSENESKQALFLLTELIASHLTYKDRVLFASNLPEQLASITLSVFPRSDDNPFDILAQFMYYQNTGKTRASKQIRAAWRAIGFTVGVTETNRVKSLLSAQNQFILG